MSAEELRRAAIALFGERGWMSRLAEALGVDRSSVSRWFAGLPVPGPVDPDPADLAARFEQAHEERYGHRDPDGEVVLVDVELAMVAPGPEPRPAAAERGRLEETSRRVWFGGEWVETPVLRGEPAAGVEAAGPVIFELPEATLVLPPGWSAGVDEAGTILARVT